MTNLRTILRTAPLAAIAAGVIGLNSPVYAEQIRVAPTISHGITLDGDTADWDGIAGITVPLSGNGGVDSVELKSVVHGDMIYDVMPRYEVKMNPQGSIADVRANGVWRDGRWYLELARKLDTGHADDAVIPAIGSIAIAVAAFDHVDGKNHSVSETLVVKTGGPAS